MHTFSVSSGGALCPPLSGRGRPHLLIVSLATGLPLAPSLGPPPALGERPQQLADPGHGDLAPSLTSRAVWCPSFPGPLSFSWGHHADGPGWRWCVCPVSVPAEARHLGPLCCCLWDCFQPSAWHRSSENVYVNCCRCKWPGSPKHGRELRFCSDLTGGRFVLQGRVSLQTRGQVERRRGDLLPSRVPEQR